MDLITQIRSEIVYCNMDDYNHAIYMISLASSPVQIDSQTHQSKQSTLPLALAPAT